MQIETLVLGQTNCYLISTDKAAIIIDPAEKSELTKNFFLQNPEKEKLILITHGHFDHIGGAADLREDFGVKIAIGKEDNIALSDNVINEGAAFDCNIEPFSADILVSEGDFLSVGDISIKVLETPGHTVGGVCYYIDDVLFTGDVLFYRGFGNTAFHGGNRRKLFYSLQRLFNEFPLDTKVLSGHGKPTTIGDEKTYYGR